MENESQNPSPPKITLLSPQTNRGSTKRSYASKTPKDGELKRADAALGRLGIDPDELAKQPNISDMLKRVFGTASKAIDALRFSTDPIAVAFLEAYDGLPICDRETYLTLEAICLKAQVSPPALLGATLMASKQLMAQESALKAMVAHPDVVDSTIQFAKLPGGYKDRKMLHESVGFLPTNKGNSLNVQLVNGVTQYNTNSEDSDDEESFGQAFPSINAELEGWSENRRLLLDGKK